MFQFTTMKSVETYTKSFYDTNNCIVNGYKFEDKIGMVWIYGQVKHQGNWLDFSLEPTYDEYLRLIRISERKEKINKICQNILKVGYLVT